MEIGKEGRKTERGRRVRGHTEEGEAQRDCVYM